jgi:hypothetical protein
VNRGTRLAVVAGIIIAIAAGATILAVTTAPTPPLPPESGGNSTNSEPRQFTVEINENLSVEAK